MIKNPKYTVFETDVHKDIIKLIHEMNDKIDHRMKRESSKIEINTIELNKYFEKWTYHINYTAYYPTLAIVKSNINFYSSERHSSLDNKIEQYLDNYLIKSHRDKQLEELGLV